MAFSLTHGHPIARELGDGKDKIIRIVPKDHPELIEYIQSIVKHLVDSDNITVKEATELKSALRHDTTEGLTEYLTNLYHQLQRSITKKFGLLSDEYYTLNTLRPIPNEHGIQRTMVYCCGASGSGKSYYCGNLLKEYKKLHPKNTIYLFSTVGEDKALDKVGVKRVRLESFVDMPPFTDDEMAIEFKDSCCVFDDVDSITNKKLRTAILDFKNRLLETGRHYRCSVITTSHTICAGHRSKMALTECNSFVIYPSTTPKCHIRRLLEVYLGISDKEQQKKILKTPSRYLCIQTNPMHCIHQGGCFMIK